MSQPNYIIVPEFCTVLLVLHFVTDQPNLNLTQLQVVVLLPSGVVHWSNQPCWTTLMRRFSWACIPSLIALGCLEVGEQFTVVVGSFPLQKPHYTNLKLGWVRLRLGWAVTIWNNTWNVSCRIFKSYCFRPSNGTQILRHIL